MPFPTISVILPFRNAGDTLDEAIPGVLPSGMPDLELVAVDDGSTDDGAERVRRWEARDARVRLVRGPGRGLISALNFGLSAARGELIARMDGDDICDPSRLVKQASLLMERPDIGLVATQVRAFASEGSVGEGMLRYVAWQNTLVSPEDHRRELFVESPVCHPSVMVRRALIDQVGGYRDTGGPEDYDLWLRLDAAGCAFAKIPEVLLSWRHRAGRATFSDTRYSLPNMRAAKAPFLAERVRAANKARIVAWGAGPTGRRLMRDVEQHGIRADLFIDIDPNKIGRVARGVPIADADALNPETDVVIAAVGARGARDLIRPDLERRGFREGVDFWCAS